ncbi:MAG: peptidoglycan DD-metalloendopeptidase family protein, partial [Gammaproteobacteria bacterium]|nr:peptidoglycan DD-metalloendopeptidase family protein [Gammaproteobacteria bacterium]
RIEQNQKNITAETNRLVALEAKEQHELQHLVISKKTRAALLHKIDAKLKTEQQKLHKQKTDKKNLAKIINRLKSSTIATEFTANLKHPHKKLSWPTNGKIENLYGSKIMHSQLKSSGVLIQAPEGRAVHAVATGRVVFSEWLSGYGLLIIINHGHGYMSLYGRNATLNKKVGDIVQKGTTIATVGKSGGYQHPSLYFAMRHNGNPVNPALWCR